MHWYKQLSYRRGDKGYCCELLKISYLCTGINNHAGQVGLLRMDFPRVFILMRDYDRAYWTDFDEWKRDLVEVNFFTPSERNEANLDEILREAWNLLALEEEVEERQAELREEDDDW